MIYNLKDFISSSSVTSDNTFVGIKCNEGKISISLPVGFRVSEDDKSLRKDILLLLYAIRNTFDKRDSDSILSSLAKTNHTESFPISSYLFVISDFMNRGYFKEKETVFAVDKKGKIQWGRTIKRIHPYIQNNQAFYLDFITRKNPLSENELITQIHEFCVYESFMKLGWLYTSKLPKKPRIKFNLNLFLSIVNEKLGNSFIDENKKLFHHMIQIIKCSESNVDQLNYTYGTDRFEYVWEKLIDEVFGIKDKFNYFPKTKWIFRGNNQFYDNSSLEPDTIMLYDNKIYILDAKYYKFGRTKRPSDLPSSSSINKQITYGEYAEKLHQKNNVRNAFLMPFSSYDWNSPEPFMYIGDAVSEWKLNNLPYESIKGILVDTNYLLNAFHFENKSLIIKLSKLIEDSFVTKI